MPPTTQINIRRDTAANFTSANPTLALGEIAYETDTRNIKVGDGATAWTALGYINPYRGGTAAADTSNVALGNQAGNALASGGINNVMVGELAGRSVTTGDDNVAIGRRAMINSSSTASANVMIGSFTGANVTGDRNVGIGSEYSTSGAATLNLLTSGAQNVAVGARTSVNLTTGSNTTAVGYEALRLNTASDITAVGANALDANTTGTVNTAVGSNALGANTTGSHNAALGLNALLGNTTGNFNTGIGRSALQSNTTGGDNVAVGQFAFGTNTTGSSNCAIGGNAGRYRGSGTDTVTVASNSVFIGVDSRAAGDSQSNQIVIGHNALGNGSNTTTIGNSSTTGTFIPAGNLTVGSSATPTGALTINATSNAPGLSWNGGTDLLTLRTPTEYYGEPSIAFFTAGNIGSKIGCKNVNFGAHDILFATRLNTSGSTALTERMRILHNGRVGIGTAAPSEFVHINGGNLRVQSGNVILTSGNGIDFSATSDGTGTMTSELLSDYEEGTWTPTYVMTGTNFAALTMDVVSATYTKIGRQVTVRGFIRTDNVDVTGATGSVWIGGLPFALPAGDAARTAGCIGTALNWTNAPDRVMTISGTNIVIYRGAAINISAADMVAGATADQNRLEFAITYFT